MLHISSAAGNLALNSRLRGAAPTARGGPAPEQGRFSQGLVHIVDPDEDVRRLLTSWLAASGLESHAYSCLAAFLETPRPETPSCMVIDVSCIEACAHLPAVRCPIVMTAHLAEIAMVVRALKTGAFDFIEKPFCETQIVAVVREAVGVDRKQRLIASNHAELRARFETLSPRERQVMALVTAGKLNKQVAGDLGLSEITVKAHRGAVMRKMDARTLANLVRMADALEEMLAS
jgi:FixJ family two-component response regulator